MLTAFLALAVFGGSVVVLSLRSGLNNLEARLGADIILVPSQAQSKVSFQNMFLQGTTGAFYMDASALDKALEVSGVEKAAPQTFLASLKADCCSIKIQVIGIDPERAALYRLCEERDVGITVMKGFFGGALFDPKRSPFGAVFTPAQLIHYALTRPAVASILCGYDTCEQIDAAVAYETATPDERDYASVIAGAPLHSYMGQCTYCGHCKPCPMEIDIAMVNKFYDLAVQQPQVPESLREHYRALGPTAADCVGCQSCEERCPFGVKIAERMTKAAELFGC